MATPTKNAIPSGFHTITPNLVIKDADKAIEFYKKAFGAEEVHVLRGPDGKVGHADLKIGDSHLFVVEESPQCGGMGPSSLNGFHASMHLYVADCDKAFQRAVDAGATSVMPPTDMFWGDRFGRLVDPFGQPWAFATHKEDVTPKEMEERMQAFCKQMATAGAK